LANKISDETIEYVGILAKLELSGEEKEAAKKMKEVMEESVVISQSNIDEIASSMFKSRPKESQETSQENDQKGE